MNIRAKAVGEILEFSVVCPDDNETEVDVEVNIEDIKVEKSEGHDNKIDLENGYGLVMKYPSIKYAIQNSEKLSNSKIDAEFELIVDCIEQIYNAEEVWETNTCSREEICDFVEKFNSKQYQKVKSFFDTMPKLKHTIQVTNPKTGVVSPLTIEGLNNFFA